MEKNIVEYVMNNKGEIIEKVADYIGFEHFSETIENLYRGCLTNYDNAEEIEEYLSDLDGFNIQSLAREFALKVNKEMKSYLHMNNHWMIGNFANVEHDYPVHVTGKRWSSQYNGDDYFDLFPQMVARLDAAEDSKLASDDRAYLEEWYFSAFGTFTIKYNFNEMLAEVSCALAEECMAV